MTTLLESRSPQHAAFLNTSGFCRDAGVARHPTPLQQITFEPGHLELVITLITQAVLESGHYLTDDDAIILAKLHLANAAAKLGTYRNICSFDDVPRWIWVALQSAERLLQICYDPSVEIRCLNGKTIAYYLQTRL